MTLPEINAVIREATNTVMQLEAKNARLRAALERCVTELGYILVADDPSVTRSDETEKAWEAGRQALKGEKP